MTPQMAGNVISEGLIIKKNISGGAFSIIFQICQTIKKHCKELTTLNDLQIFFLAK